MSIVRMEVVSDVVDPEATDVYVEGHIGDAAVRFRLDTGAGTCRIGTESTAGLVAVGTSCGVAASGVGLDEDEVVIPLLRLGDHELVDVAATRIPLAAGLTPLLGMSALSRHWCRFRFDEGELELIDSLPDDHDGWMPHRGHASGHVLMTVRFGDIEITGVWDTGAGLTAVDVGFAAAHPQLFETLRSATGIDASGVEIASDLATMAACSIGDVEFPSTVCALVDLSAVNDHLRLQAEEAGRPFEPMLFIIGMPLIQLAHWDFDFPAARWTLTRPT